MDEHRDDETRGPELVDRAASGDGVAIDALLEHNLPRLLAYVRLRAAPLIRQNESCGDIVASVCRELLENMSGFDYRGEAAFRGWLFTAALRKLNQHMRRLTELKRDVRRNVPLSQTGQSGLDGLEGLYAQTLSPSQNAVANETAAKFEAAFGELSESDQEIVLMARIVGFSYAEIAEQTGATVGAVRTRLCRALGRLGRLMSH